MHLQVLTYLFYPPPFLKHFLHIKSEAKMISLLKYIEAAEYIQAGSLGKLSDRNVSKFITASTLQLPNSLPKLNVTTVCEAPKIINYPLIFLYVCVCVCFFCVNFRFKILDRLFLLLLSEKQVLYVIIPSVIFCEIMMSNAIYWNMDAIMFDMTLNSLVDLREGGLLVFWPRVIGNLQQYPYYTLVHIYNYVPFSMIYKLPFSFMLFAKGIYVVYLNYMHLFRFRHVIHLYLFLIICFYINSKVPNEGAYESREFNLVTVTILCPFFEELFKYAFPHYIGTMFIVSWEVYIYQDTFMVMVYRTLIHSLWTWLSYKGDLPLAILFHSVNNLGFMFTTTDSHMLMMNPDLINVVIDSSAIALRFKSILTSSDYTNIPMDFHHILCLFGIPTTDFVGLVMTFIMTLVEQSKSYMTQYVPMSGESYSLWDFITSAYSYTVTSDNLFALKAIASFFRKLIINPLTKTLFNFTFSDNIVLHMIMQFVRSDDALMLVQHIIEFIYKIFSNIGLILQGDLSMFRPKVGDVDQFYLDGLKLSQSPLDTLGAYDIVVYKTHIHAWLLKFPKIMKELDPKDSRRASFTRISAALEILLTHEVFKKFLTTPIPKRVGIVVMGPPGQGKSTLVAHLCDLVAAYLDADIGTPSHAIWKPNVNFQDGWCNSVTGLVITDADATYPSPSMIHPYTIIQDIMNDVPYPIESARVEEKGTSYFAGSMVVLSQNTDLFADESFIYFINRDVTPLRRRYPHRFNVKAYGMYTTDGLIDPKKTLFKSTTHDYFYIEYSKINMKGVYSEPKVITFNEMVKIVIDEIAKNRDDFARASILPTLKICPIHHCIPGPLCVVNACPVKETKTNKQYVLNEFISEYGNGDHTKLCIPYEKWVLDNAYGPKEKPIDPYDFKKYLCYDYYFPVAKEFEKIDVQVAVVAQSFEIIVFTTIAVIFTQKYFMSLYSYLDELCRVALKLVYLIASDYNDVRNVYLSYHRSYECMVAYISIRYNKVVQMCIKYYKHIIGMLIASLTLIGLNNYRKKRIEPFMFSNPTVNRVDYVKQSPQILLGDALKSTTPQVIIDTVGPRIMRFDINGDVSHGLQLTQKDYLTTSHPYNWNDVNTITVMAQFEKIDKVINGCQQIIARMDLKSDLAINTHGYVGNLRSIANVDACILSTNHGAMFHKDIRKFFLTQYLPEGLYSGTLLLYDIKVEGMQTIQIPRFKVTRESLQYSRSADKRQFNNECIAQLPIVTSHGCCGSVLIVNINDKVSAIFGVLVAGNNNVTIVSQVLIKHLTSPNYMGPIADITTDSINEVIAPRKVYQLSDNSILHKAVGHTESIPGNAVGTVIPYFAPSAGVAMAHTGFQVPLPLFDKDMYKFPTDKLVDGEPMGYPMRINYFTHYLIKRAGKCDMVDPLELKIALEFCCKRVDTLKFERPGILTIQEAIRGIPGDKVIHSINNSTSAGWNCPGPKTQFMIMTPTPEDPHNFTYTKEIMDKVDRVMSNLHQGKPIIFIANIIVKSNEAIKKTKVSRSISVFNLEDLIVIRRYFLPIIKLLLSDFKKFGMCVGKNCYSSDWVEMFDHLFKKAFDGDFKGFDLSLLAQVLSVVFAILIRCGLRLLYTETDIRHCIAILSALLNMCILYKGDLMFLFGIQASGVSLTTIINCLVVYVLYVICIIRKSQSYLQRFDELFRFLIYGDDSVVSVNEEVEDIFTFEYFQSNMATMGMQLTPASKEETGESKLKANNIEFLKRRFKPYVYAEKEYLFCPLDLTSLWKSLSFYEPSKVLSKNDQLSEIIENVNRELFFHGEEVFKQHRNMLVSFYEVVSHKTLVDFDYIMAQYISGEIQTPYA